MGDPVLNIRFCLETRMEECLGTIKLSKSFDSITGECIAQSPWCPPLFPLKIYYICTLDVWPLSAPDLLLWTLNRYIEYSSSCREYVNMIWWFCMMVLLMHEWVTFLRFCWVVWWLCAELILWAGRGGWCCSWGRVSCVSLHERGRRGGERI